MSKKEKINKWLEDNYTWLLGEIETNICKGMMNEYSGDLAIHIVEDLYRLDESKIDQMIRDDKLGWYLLVGAGRQLRSKTSPFYRTYRKEKMNSREAGIPGSDKNIFDRPDEPYSEDLYECFQQAYEELHWYEKALMDKYFYQEWTLQQMYEFYGITKNHIIKDLNQAIEKIREYCKEC